MDPEAYEGYLDLRRFGVFRVLSDRSFTNLLQDRFPILVLVLAWSG